MRGCLNFCVPLLFISSLGLVLIFSLWYNPVAQDLATTSQGSCIVYSTHTNMGWCGKTECCFASREIVVDGYTDQMDQWLGTFDTCDQAQSYINSWSWVGMFVGICTYRQKTGEILYPAPSTTVSLLFGSIFAAATGIFLIVVLFNIEYSEIPPMWDKFIAGCLKCCRCSRKGYDVLNEQSVV